MYILTIQKENKMAETTNQLEELTNAINWLSEAIENLQTSKGQMGYTVADSLEQIAIEMFYERERKEEQDKKVASATR